MKSFSVSISGADWGVKTSDLRALSKEFPFVRWGILYSSTKASTSTTSRYPTLWWMQNLMEQESGQKHAEPFVADIHLCDKGFYDRLLASSIETQPSYPTLKRLIQGRSLQVNINARSIEYIDEEVVRVYRELVRTNPVILQQHKGTQRAIDMFLQELQDLNADLSGISILQDASRGKGVVTDSWRAPMKVGGYTLSTGFAGGVGPENIDEMLDRLLRVTEGSEMEHGWIDMESGVRTSNVFDLRRVTQVLERVATRANELPLTEWGARDSANHQCKRSAKRVGA